MQKPTTGKLILSAIGEYGSRLFSFIRNRVDNTQDSEDILQEVWLQLSNHEEIETIEQMGAWLYKVARNKITDRYRKKGTASLDDMIEFGDEGEVLWSPGIAEDSDSPEHMLMNELLWDSFQDALAALPQKQREVFVKNELEGFTLQQIADESGESLKTIISRKGYAVQRLREQLGELYSEITETTIYTK